MAARRVICFLLSALAVARLAQAQPLPEGDNGIAARYPEDAGIGSDPAVIFADDFESYARAGSLNQGWDEAYHAPNIRIASEPGNYYSGRQSVELTVRRTGAEVSNNLVKYIDPERSVLFVRYYAKFDAGFDVIGSSHNGVSMSARYCCPGVPADGFNKFFVSYEAWRDDGSAPNPGNLNVYLYHPDQRDVYGDHFFPTGIVIPFDRVPFDFDSQFVSRPDVVPDLGRWQSYELMVKTNTPGQRDGRIAAWLDGALIADFTGLRLRETVDLEIDRFSLDLHVLSNSRAAARKWYDNVVAATSYIGPMVPRADSQ